MMSANVVILIMWGYAAIYYVLVRWVRSEVARADPNYFEPGAESGMKRATATWDMMLDSKLPGNFGAKIKYGIYAARTMLILYVPILIVVFAAYLA